MRVMMANVMMLLLSASFVIYTKGFQGPNLAKLSDDPKTVLDIMKRHFDSSLDYLYTGVQYEGQYLERPGLAKKLRGMSDAHWEAGMAALNKYLEIGGVTGSQFFMNKLDFSGGEKANFNKDSKGGEIYMNTFETLVQNSQELLELYENVYSELFRNMDQKKELTRLVNFSQQYQDFHSNQTRTKGDMAHYLEEKIENEVKHFHELKGHITTLNQMKGIGAAVAAFDSNL